MKQSKILLLENIHPIAKTHLESEGFYVELFKDSPEEPELIQIAKKFDVIGIRSKTLLANSFFKENPQLLCVGAFCIGTNQIDLHKANSLGIPVFNAPYSNTRSVAEMVIAEVICLSRQLFERSAKAHIGSWMKNAEGSKEVRGKTIGIIGYGHIGTQLSILAEAIGLKVIYYDIVKKLPIGNAQSVSTLEELLTRSDFVSLHVPETPQTQNMISHKELSQMKKGSFLINASRGTVVVIDALAKALKSNQLGGAAIDVFPTEPASNKDAFSSVLQGIPNVILTPHVGGSTEEAQHSIGQEVAQSFTSFLKIGSTTGAVNFPNVDLPVHQSCHRILNIHKNEPGVLGEINKIVSEAGGNIEAQYLSTDSRIGYLVMDVDKANAVTISDSISRLSRSLRTRLLY